MGTVADKLNYLNDTKKEIKQAIERTGTVVPTGTKFRQYAQKIDEVYPDALFKKQLAESFKFPSASLKEIFKYNNGYCAYDDRHIYFFDFITGWSKPVDIPYLNLTYSKGTFVCAMISGSGPYTHSLYVKKSNDYGKTWTSYVFDGLNQVSTIEGLAYNGEVCLINAWSYDSYNGFKGYIYRLKNSDGFKKLETLNLQQFTGKIYSVDELNAFYIVQNKNYDYKIRYTNDNGETWKRLPTSEIDNDSYADYYQSFNKIDNKLFAIGDLGKKTISKVFVNNTTGVIIQNSQHPKLINVDGKYKIVCMFLKELLLYDLVINSDYTTIQLGEKVISELPVGYTDLEDAYYFNGKYIIRLYNQSEQTYDVFYSNNFLGWSKDNTKVIYDKHNKDVTKDVLNFLNSIEATILESAYTQGVNDIVNAE